MDYPTIQPLLKSVESIFGSDPLCRQIILFLLKNETAMDTARGIAAWWVCSDEVAVQAALDHLIAQGVVSTYTFTSGALYGLTRNPEIRSWLRAMCSASPAGNTEWPEGVSDTLAKELNNSITQ